MRYGQTDESQFPAADVGFGRIGKRSLNVGMLVTGYLCCAE